MNRDELAALRDAISRVLAWPDAVCDQVAAWLAPNAVAANAAPGQQDAEEKPGDRKAPAANAVPKPNGHDRHPPLAAPERVTETAGVSARRSPTPYAGKARRGKPSAKTAERKLLEAMRETPGLSVAALANAAASSRSATGERLRQLASRGVVTKDSAGRWKLKGEEPDPPQPSPS